MWQQSDNDDRPDKNSQHAIDWPDSGRTRMLDDAVRCDSVNGWLWLWYKEKRGLDQHSTKVQQPVRTKGDYQARPGTLLRL
jgi:hypothetical protein